MSVRLRRGFANHLGLMGPHPIGVCWPRLLYDGAIETMQNLAQEYDPRGVSFLDKDDTFPEMGPMRGLIFGMREYLFSKIGPLRCSIFDNANPVQ